MKLQKTVLAVLFFASVSTFRTAEALPSDQDRSIASNQQSKDALLKYLIPALRSAGAVGRIYYQATCRPDDYRFRFPEIRVAVTSRAEVGLDAIQEMLRSNDDVEVTEQTPGIISVHIGKMPEEILHTRIAILNLDQDAQYSGAMAIARVESSPEVQAAMQKLEIGGGSRSISIILVPPTEGRPHLPSSIENVTMDQALDVVARTFGVVVLYGACTQPNLYEIDLVGDKNDEVSNPLSRPPISNAR
jgi:hypothetical protein